MALARHEVANLDRLRCGYVGVAAGEGPCPMPVARRLVLTIDGEESTHDYCVLHAELAKALIDGIARQRGTWLTRGVKTELLALA
jgi:hypothetical protein